MYWGIPPEVNAFRLTMMGAGPTAHVPQLTAYADASITHLEQAAQQAVTTAATAPSFEGLGGAGMVAAASPMSAWLGTAGAHAGAAAATVQGAVAGYSSAVAATIPYPVVVENRLREAVLEATNLLGQNTPAIAETNAEYGEFWGQNAGAMMGYLASTTAAVQALSVPLPPLTEMSNPIGAAAGLAGLATEGISGGVQALGAGFSAGEQGVSSAVGAGVGAVASGVAGVQAAESGVQALGAQTGAGGQGAASSGTGAGLIGASARLAASPPA
ncbi:MAG: PPE family protein, partial [Mycobacterium sp.]